MIERHVPWGNNIYLIMNVQKPEWLDLSHPKLRFMSHKEFIPEFYLLTYNSVAIELNLHRIKDLSEKFIYFNTDTYLIKDIKLSDFLRIINRSF